MSTEARAARMGDNYPYFVYATGSVKLKNRSTGEEILNSIFKDAKGADFSSQEKAGMNALKKLSQNNYIFKKPPKSRFFDPQNFKDRIFFPFFLRTK